MIDDDVQVVQCPSCGVCYKVTQKRQLMSLQKRQFSAVSVSPLTKFWCAVWALLGFGFLFGERTPTCCSPQTHAHNLTKSYQNVL